MVAATYQPDANGMVRMDEHRDTILHTLLSPNGGEWNRARPLEITRVDYRVYPKAQRVELRTYRGKLVIDTCTVPIEKARQHYAKQLEAGYRPW